MDEFWEVLAGAQLEQHSKPCGLLNISGYYDSLLAFMDRALREGLISLSDKNNVIVGDNSKVLIERLFEAVAVTRLPALRDSRREERAKS
jgi:predicted Rossmann-fold nucleotide-binding protein